MGSSLASSAGMPGPTCQAEQSQASPGFLSTQEPGQGCGKQSTHFKGPVDSRASFQRSWNFSLRACMMAETQEVPMGLQTQTSRTPLAGAPFSVPQNSRPAAHCPPAPVQGASGQTPPPIPELYVETFLQENSTDRQSSNAGPQQCQPYL